LIYTSTDAGGTWAPTLAPTNEWAAVACSADGTQLVAADSGDGDGLIYASTNAGLSWTPTAAPVGFWTSIASSADGSRIAVTGYPGGIYTWQSPPALNITYSSGKLFLDWQVLSSASGFGLQETTDLAATNWVTVASLPVVTNGFNQVMLTLPPGGNEFYRLEKP
jgi:hypothetical protein